MDHILFTTILDVKRFVPAKILFTTEVCDAVGSSVILLFRDFKRNENTNDGQLGISFITLIEHQSFLANTQITFGWHTVVCIRYDV